MTLREARVAAGLSQAQVARVLGVANGCYHNWEVGLRHVPCWVVDCLRERLGWDVEYTGQKGAPQPSRAQPRRPGLFVEEEPKTDRHLRLAAVARDEKHYVAALVVMCCRPLREVDRLLGTDWRRGCAI